MRSVKVKSEKCEEIEDGQSIVKSSLNHFRLPVTSRCKAAHRSTIKKDVVVKKIKEETNPGLKFKQVIQKSLKINNLPLQDLSQNTAPNPILLFSKTARQVA